MKEKWRRTWPYNLGFPGASMSRDRFEAILNTSLKISNPEDDNENNRKRGTPAYDRHFKIKPPYNAILTACQSFFQSGEEISIDERMVA